MAFDVKKMAAGLKLKSEGKDESEAPEAKKDDTDESPGSKALAAIKSGNVEAFEEAIRAIVG